MKELVQEQLAQRDLAHLFSESSYNKYLRKAKAIGGGGNEVLIALKVLDLFILNEPHKASLAA